jgi:hypothetical protein
VKSAGIRKLVNKMYIKREDVMPAVEDAMELYPSEYDSIANKVDNILAVDVVEVPKTGIGDLSDGYHTFNELYHHRAILFSVICNMFPDKAWKSKLHDTGDMFEGMFIVGIETPKGQATYHYDIDPYWDMFKVKELDRAPTWDGHAPEDAIDRISKLTVTHATWRLESDAEERNPMFKLVECSNCKHLANTNYKFCPYCGATMTDLIIEGVNDKI